MGDSLAPRPQWRERIRLIWNLAHWPLNRRLVLIGVAVGLAAGGSAYILEQLTGIIWQWGLGSLPASPFWVRGVLLVSFPALGGLLAGWITHFYSPESRGHGTAAVIKALREDKGFIPGHVALAKTAATAATLGLGGSAGQEGPIIQIGASVGSSLGRRLGVPPEDWRTLATAGAAGGLAAAFSVPLAGVFFTMEVLLRDFANEAFPAVVIASVTGAAVARTLIGHEGFLTPVAYQSSGATDYLIYGVFALLCAGLGRLYNFALKKGETVFEKWHAFPTWLKPALGGALVGAMALGLPEIMGAGRETINGLLLQKRVGWNLALLAPGKILATAITLGSGGSGGALMPTFFVGAAAGGLWAHLVGLIPHLTTQPGAGALVGMACVFTAAFNAPVTGMIMAFELSQDYGILPVVMLACVITHMASRPSK